MGGGYPLPNHLIWLDNKLINIVVYNVRILEVIGGLLGVYYVVIRGLEFVFYKYSYTS